MCIDSDPSDSCSLKRCSRQDPTNPGFAGILKDQTEKSLNQRSDICQFWENMVRPSQIKRGISASQHTHNSCINFNTHTCAPCLSCFYNEGRSGGFFVDGKKFEESFKNLPEKSFELLVPMQDFLKVSSSIEKVGTFSLWMIGV